MNPPAPQGGCPHKGGGGCERAKTEKDEKEPEGGRVALKEPSPKFTESRLRLFTTETLDQVIVIYSEVLNI